MEYPELTWDDTDPEIVQKAWKQRGDRLAQASAPEEQGRLVDLVVVKFGGEIFGIEAKDVSTIRPVGQVTPIPRTPAWVLGVVNLRGRIVSLIDLRLFYHLQDAEKPAGPSLPFTAEESPSMVVVEANGMEVALFVKQVITVEAYSLNRIREASDILPRFPKGAVSGILISPLKMAGEDRAMIIILNVPALLADKHLIVNEDLG